MKRTLFILIVCILCVPLSACSNEDTDRTDDDAPAPVQDTREDPLNGTAADKVILLIRDMMALDYEDMTVAEFNGTIQELSSEQRRQHERSCDLHGR